MTSLRGELAEIIDRLPRGRDIFTYLCSKLSEEIPDNNYRRSYKGVIDYNRKIDWRKIAKKAIKREERLIFFSSIDRSICDLEERLQNISYSNLPLLDDFCHFLLSSGGKRLRPSLAFLAASFQKDGEKKAMSIALALELIHMASLTHDDVIDQASLRRGLPTAWVILGEKMAIQIGDLLLAKVMNLISEYEDARIAEVLADVSMKMCLGEFSQLSSIDSVQAFDLGQYYFRIGAKTALLISASCQTGAIAAGLSEEYLKSLSGYGYYLGMIFQISDDILDLLATKERSGKEQGMDLKRGIITLPVLYALNNSDQTQEIYKLCRKKDISGRDLKTIVHSVKLLGGFASSMETVEDFYFNAVSSIDKLPDYPQKEDLYYLADLIKSRSSININ